MSERIVVSDKDYGPDIGLFRKREQLDTDQRNHILPLDMEDWKVNNDGK